LTPPPFLPFDNGYEYTVDYNDTTSTAQLMVSVVLAVPEMSTWGAMVLMLVALFFDCACCSL
jgi:hypothetical protein